MKRWVVYLKERSPFVPLLVLSAGVVESARTLSGAHPSAAARAAWILFYLVFFICLRMMDELKDFKKDQVVHPERPLPRGLISKAEMGRAIVIVGVALAFFGAALGFVSSIAAGALAVFSVFYAYLMFKEFFVGEGLGKMPLIYAITHQALCVPLYTAVWFAFAPDLSRSWELYLAYSVGAGFTYEIGRKLDPRAHPALGTYRHLSGDARTFAFYYALIAVCAWSAWQAGYGPLLWPFEALCALTAVLVLRGAAKAHKAAEGATVLSATIHLWAPVLGAFFHLGGQG